MTNRGDLSGGIGEKDMVGLPYIDDLSVPLWRGSFTQKNGDSGGLVEPALGDFIKASARDFKKSHVLSVVAGSDDIPYSLIQINPMNSPDTTTCDACGKRYPLTSRKDRCPVCCPEQEDESDSYEVDDWGTSEDE